MCVKLFISIFEAINQQYTNMDWSLFDPTKYEKRGSTNYSEVISALEQEFGPIGHIFEKAFELTTQDIGRRPRHFQNRNSASLRMNENLHGLLFEHYTPERIKLEPHGVFYLDWHSEYKVYFKKLNKNFIPQYNSTNASEKRLHQRQLYQDDSNPILYFGYHVTEMWGALNGIYLVSIDNRTLKWRHKIVPCEIIKNEVDRPVSNNADHLVRAKNKIKKAK